MAKGATSTTMSNDTDLPSNSKMAAAAASDPSPSHSTPRPRRTTRAAGPSSSALPALPAAAATDYHESAARRTTSHAGLFVSPPHALLHPSDEEASFVFVCLGVGGGPLEADCSCYMLKPAQRPWTEGSIVIEGGSWLGALTRVLEDVGPKSAFYDVDFPYESPALRAGFLGSFAHSFLISHAHLDHILGLVLGSASLPGKRNVYGLKGTLDNLLGVFNGKIWPKLASYEDEGGPAVYRLRALEPHARAHVDDDMTVLPFALSHGLNPSVIPAPPTPTPAFATRLSLSSKRLSLPLNGYFTMLPTGGTGLVPATTVNTPSGGSDRPIFFTSPFAPQSSIAEHMSSLSVQDRSSTDKGRPSTPPRRESDATSMDPPTSPTTASSTLSQPPAPSASTSTFLRGNPVGSLRLSAARSRRPRTAQGSEKAGPPSPGLPPPASTLSSKLDVHHRASIATGVPMSARKQLAPSHVNIEQTFPALDSTAFFLTNERTGKDVLFFGDVEPDSVSQSPRNGRIWAHAGKRFAEGMLNTVFLECSFPASHPTEFLYGHLSVSHVFDELRTLARSVMAERKRSSARRKNDSLAGRAVPASRSGSSDGASYRIRASQLPPIPALHTSERTVTDEELHNSLAGLHIVIIHVKTALFPSYEATARPSNASTASYATAENGDHSAGDQEILIATDESADATFKRATSPELIPNVTHRSMDVRSMHERILQELEDLEKTQALGVHFIMAQQGLRIEC